MKVDVHTNIPAWSPTQAKGAFRLCFLLTSPGIIKPFDGLVWAGYALILALTILGLMAVSAVFPDAGVAGAANRVMGVVGFVTGEPLTIDTRFDQPVLFRAL